ncbi:MAG: Gfo/Idh/MocA family oxidoreductase [Oscillospiraceae bacterium]|nr:Gfo/Idh/MocA family oxidoreductase [Oscillospiraceae bacterium]
MSVQNNSAKKYKISVIGAGDRGGCYMAMLQKYRAENIEFLGVCDILEDRLDKAYETYGFKAKFTDWKEALTATKPDIAIIATPAFYHCDMAAFAMDAGCHVLTEKPFDLDLKKCFELKKKQEETKKSIAIGLQYRNGRNHRAMKNLMDEKILGSNVIMTYTDVRENRPKLAMHDARRGNGGPLVDMACHLFDLMRWFYKSDPKSASAVWRISGADKKELESIEFKAPDTCVMMIEYESGDLGSITMNWGMPSKTGGQFLSHAAGSEGYVTEWGADITVRSGAGTTVVGISPEDEQDMVNAELAVYDHLIAEIEGRGKVQASFDEGILSLATSMAAIKSGVLGRVVTIKEILDQKPTIEQCMTKI